MDSLYENIVTLQDLEQQAQKMVHLMFILCEKHQMTLQPLQETERKALAASVMAVQQSIKVFLALENSMK